jgi:hypothetical protein
LQFESLLGSRIVLERDSVSQVTRRSPQVEEYVTRARRAPDTVEAHWELAEWCRNHRLGPQRAEQLEAIVALEPDHAAARRGLNHVRHRGRWMTQEAAFEEQGYILHKGKYITRQELEIEQQSATQRAAELDWYPKVRLWTGWTTGAQAARRAAGLANLQAIDDPAAIPALAQHLGRSDDGDSRRLFVRILSQIPGAAPVGDLVRLSLLDVVREIREAAFEALTSERWPMAQPLYVEALGHARNDVVRRAARALAVLQDDRTVPALIAALVTRHRVEVAVPVGYNVSFSNSPQGPSMSSGSGLPGNIELLLRTGQLPHGVVSVDNSSRQPTRTVVVPVDVSNDEVRSALKSITGQDFGFDQDAWQLYWAAQANAPDRTAAGTR